VAEADITPRSQKLIGMDPIAKATNSKSAQPGSARARDRSRIRLNSRSSAHPALWRSGGKRVIIALDFGVRNSSRRKLAHAESSSPTSPCHGQSTQRSAERYQTSRAGSDRRGLLSRSGHPHNQSPSKGTVESGATGSLEFVGVSSSFQVSGARERKKRICV